MQDNNNAQISFQTLLSIGEASDYLGVSIDTLRRWEKKGKIETYRSPGNHRYFKKNDLDNLFGKKYERDPEVKPRKVKDVNEEDATIKTSKNDQDRVVQEAFTAPTPLLVEKPLNRPVRDVLVPPSNPIRIIKEEARIELMSSITSVEEQDTPSLPQYETPSDIAPPPVIESQEIHVTENIVKEEVATVKISTPVLPNNESVLTPPKLTNQVKEDVTTPKKPETEKHEEKEEKKEEQSNTKLLLIVSATVIAVILAIVMLVVNFSEPQVLSPISN